MEEKNYTCADNIEPAILFKHLSDVCGHQEPFNSLRIHRFGKNKNIRICVWTQEIYDYDCGCYWSRRAVAELEKQDGTFVTIKDAEPHTCDEYYDFFEWLYDRETLNVA